MSIRSLLKDSLLHRKQLLRTQSALLQLIGLLLPALQLLLVLIRDALYLFHILAKAKLLESFGDVFACDCLLGFFLTDFVGFRGDERDKLDAAFDEEIARVFAKCYARGGWEYFRDDLLNGC